MLSILSATYSIYTLLSRLNADVKLCSSWLQISAYFQNFLLPRLPQVTIALFCISLSPQPLHFPLWGSGSYRWDWDSMFLSSSSFLFFGYQMIAFVFSLRTLLGLGEVILFILTKIQSFENLSRYNSKCPWSTDTKKAVAEQIKL